MKQISVESGGAPNVAAIISLARMLRLRVVAEGVETAAQLAFLQGLACDEAQGFYFSRAVEPAAFAEYIGRRVPSQLVAASPKDQSRTIRQKFGRLATTEETIRPSAASANGGAGVARPARGRSARTTSPRA